MKPQPKEKSAPEEMVNESAPEEMMNAHLDETIVR